MSQKLTVIFSSHLSEEDNNQFIQHVKDTAGVEDLAVECIVNKNQYSLPEAYNMAWKKVISEGRGDGVLVFCHNDLILRTKEWGKLLLKLFYHTNYDIIGIAGTTELNTHGRWWSNASDTAMNTSKMFGRVSHTDGLKEWENYYGKTGGVKNAVLVDGLFIAVNGETVGKNEEEMFDERFKGFHFYDVSFCFRNYLNGFNIGVTDRLSVLHKSMGATNIEWEKNRAMFCEMYKEELPVSIK